MLSKELTNIILDTLELSQVNHIVLEDRASEYCFKLPTCDSDVICFHKGMIEPWFFGKLVVCNSYTTSEPVYKDWFMTVAYHS